MAGPLIPVVEGQSEVAAVGGLLRRLVPHLDLPHVEISRPFRVKRNKVLRPQELERCIAQAVGSRPGACGVVVLLDADTDCPAELGPALMLRASAATGLPVRIVIPKVEIEAWVLGAVESVRGVRGIRADATSPADPEAIRDAKGALTALMSGTRGYVPTSDLPAFLARLDPGLAAIRCPSFQKLQRDLRTLVA